MAPTPATATAERRRCCSRALRFLIFFEEQVPLPPDLGPLPERVEPDEWPELGLEPTLPLLLPPLLLGTPEPEDPPAPGMADGLVTGGLVGIVAAAAVEAEAVDDPPAVKICGDEIGEMVEKVGMEIEMLGFEMEVNENMLDEALAAGVVEGVFAGGAELVVGVLTTGTLLIAWVCPGVTSEPVAVGELPV